MTLTCERTISRDYDPEFRDTADHRYAYEFDFDVMHPFMIRSFQPFFRPGVLELGSSKGDFTKRLLPYFDDITCVEASSEAIASSRGASAIGCSSYTIGSNVSLPGVRQRRDHPRAGTPR